MPDITTPSNSNTPPSSSQAGNVASLANPTTLANLKNSELPKTFGDQAKNMAVAAVITAAAQSTIARLYKEKASLIQEGIQLDIDHQKNLFKLDQKHTSKKQVVDGQTVDIPPELNDDEYAKAVAKENKNYDEAKKNLDERKKKNQKDTNDQIKDPFKKIKDERKKIKERQKKRKSKTKEEKRKARKAAAKAILKNTAKTLVPIISLLLTDKIADVIAQNDIIQKLVDDTNALIIEANESGDPVKLSNAKVARDSAVKTIQNNEDKIKNINDQIQRISLYISIFSVVVTVISSIPIPTSVPPGVGIPVNLIIKLIKILEKANKIILALSALLPALLVSLEKAIDILEEYKAQLLDINGQLDAAAAGGNTSLLSGNGFGSIDTTYKGFKFAIKEDNSFGGISVAGNKRHYAVAIDKSNVDVLKSEYSFTLDPNDLIEQLKLVIDQQNLQA
jgi:hypothetical protein